MVAARRERRFSCRDAEFYGWIFFQCAPAAVSRRARMMGPRSAPAPSEVDERDPHLRLPRALRVARAAEAVFIVVTSYVALSLPLNAHPGGGMIRARLVFEAMVALVVLLALPRRTEGARIAAIVLAAYVLVGCIPQLFRMLAALSAFPGPFAALSLVITTAACASQAVVLACSLSVRRPGAATAGDPTGPGA